MCYRVLKTLEPREHVRTCKSTITNVRNYLKLDRETQTTFYLDIKVNMFLTKLRVRKQSKENLENLAQSSIKLELVWEKEFKLFLIKDRHHDRCASLN